jgi:hypothetical protein
LRQKVSFSKHIEANASPALRSKAELIGKMAYPGMRQVALCGNQENPYNDGVCPEGTYEHALSIFIDRVFV